MRNQNYQINRSRLKHISTGLRPIAKLQGITINEALREFYKDEGKGEVYRSYKGWLEQGMQVKRGEKACHFWSQPKTYNKVMNKGCEPGFERTEETDYFGIVYLFGDKQVEKAMTPEERDARIRELEAKERGEVPAVVPAPAQEFPVKISMDEIVRVARAQEPVNSAPVSEITDTTMEKQAYSGPAKIERVFHSDPGHGWLEVKRSELKSLGIEDKVSGCSYERNSKVYLEEDCDMPLYLKAMEKKFPGVKVKLKEKYSENTFIRNLPEYKRPEKSAPANLLMAIATGKVRIR